MKISVIIPTHNPDPERLRRTLGGLRQQTLAPDFWETLVVDNASTRFPSQDFFPAHGPANLRVVSESRLGLNHARRAGLRATQGEFAVLVDDDNVLDREYLAQVESLGKAHPRLGAAGGRSLGEFEVEPPGWSREFFSLLALRDLGPSPQLVEGLRPSGALRNTYPTCAPIGAGMVLRRAAWQPWLELSASDGLITDRRGGSLSSGGDNDIVLTVLAQGWQVGYFPELSLAHLIPAGRLAPDYLARLNRGIQKSWVQVLTRHEACPWLPIAPWTVVPRKLKSWFTYRGWSQPSGYIRWQGACGHFEGLAA